MVHKVCGWRYFLCFVGVSLDPLLFSTFNCNTSDLFIILMLTVILMMELLLQRRALMITLSKLSGLFPRHLEMKTTAYVRKKKKTKGCKKRNKQTNKKKKKKNCSEEGQGMGADYCFPDLSMTLHLITSGPYRYFHGEI